MSQVIPLGPGARMLTTREAALRLGVSLRTVQLWVEADILPAARTPGGHRRIPYNAVEALALSTGLGGEIPARTSAREPLRADFAPEPVPEPQPKVRRHIGGAGGRGMDAAQVDVLLVADDAAWQVRCEQALAPFGSTVKLRFAETGYLALLQIGQCAPDVLITNLELPGMDGLAMLRTLQRCESMAGMRVLALTHLDQSELMRRGGVPDDIELLHLPVSADMVAARVGHWLLGQRVC